MNKYLCLFIAILLCSCALNEDTKKQGPLSAKMDLIAGPDRTVDTGNPQQSSSLLTLADAEKIMGQWLV